MSRQFNGRLTGDALRPHLDGPAAVSPAPAGTGSDKGTDLELVNHWLTLLHLLNGVPFNYLVPDEGMLPPESIRFFQVDNNWIMALLDGAFSVGFAGASQTSASQALLPAISESGHRARTGQVRQAQLAGSKTVTGFTVPSQQPGALSGSVNGELLTGFLLRSAVVAGWPGLEVHGFSDTAGTQPLTLVRMEAVGPSLLLCLFAGLPVARVDLQEPGEGVHFGLDPDGSGGWKKDLRYANGSAPGSFINTSVSVTLRSAAAGAPAIIPHHVLASSMAGKVWSVPPPPTPPDSSFTAAQYGLQMVEGVQAVTFQAPSQ